MIEDACEDPRFVDHPSLIARGIRSYIAVPIFTGGSEFFGTLCAQDIRPTQLDAGLLRTFRAFADLVGLHIQAEQVNADRERFLAVVAHDMRSPLSVASMVADHLATHTDRAVTALARRLHRSVHRMQAIISDTTDLVRGRFGEQLPLVRTVLDASALVQEVVEELSVAHGKTRIETELPPELSVCWDRTRIQQLVTNLVANAVQHSRGAAAVRIRLRGDTTEAILEVVNTGRPIDVSTAEVLFQPFRRGKNVAPGGLGLGLYIVRQIAQAHGGTVTVNSDGDTTTFRVALPIALLRTPRSTGRPHC